MGYCTTSFRASQGLSHPVGSDAAQICHQQAHYPPKIFLQRTYIPTSGATESVGDIYVSLCEPNLQKPRCNWCHGYLTASLKINAKSLKKNQAAFSVIQLCENLSRQINQEVFTIHPTCSHIPTADRCTRKAFQT